jgi:hypothetical protein
MVMLKVLSFISMTVKLSFDFSINCDDQDDLIILNNLLINKFIETLNGSLILE